MSAEFVRFALESGLTTTKFEDLRSAQELIYRQCGPAGNVTRKVLTNFGIE